jgi:hypothetical protein
MVAATDAFGRRESVSTVAVDGVELFYQALGSGSTIVLVHWRQR